MTKQISLILMLLSTASLAIAGTEDQQAKVMFIGAFHFSSPGLDKVKTKHIDVTTEENQAYLEQLTQRIAEHFTPDKILIECSVGAQAKIDQRFNDYLGGSYELPVNEIYQLGFRTAKAAGTKQIICFDERTIGWDADTLFEEMPENAPETQTLFNAYIDKMGTKSNQMHATMSFKQLLLSYNSVESDDRNKALYLLTNAVGAGDSFSGADAAASWWHRNFRMYANVQKAAQPGNRILVIGGQGHTAILKDMLALDVIREAVLVNDYL